MNAASAQPNVDERSASLTSVRFWSAVVLTGVGAGLGALALMAILGAVQHAAWSYQRGDFLTAVDAVPTLHRIGVVCGAGIATIIGLAALRTFTRKGPDVSNAIWFHAGRIAFARSIGNAVLSVVVVALGASLGRESAPKEVGAAFASKVCDRFGLSIAQRRLLVACGAGAGMAAVYNVPLGGALFTLEVLLGTSRCRCCFPRLFLGRLRGSSRRSMCVAFLG